MKEEIINKLLEELKNNIPEDYVRSCDTSDGVGYYELDEDSWQYQVYHYIENLQSQLKAKDEAVEKFEKYLNNCVSELENNYGLSSFQNAINAGIVEITKVILSKYKQILSKGENK